MLLCQAPEGKSLPRRTACGRLGWQACGCGGSIRGSQRRGAGGNHRTVQGVSRGGADILLQNGVAVLEMRAGRAELIRGVSTRTKTDGVSDRTFHDINTVLIIDTVIAGD